MGGRIPSLIEIKSYTEPVPEIEALVVMAVRKPEMLEQVLVKLFFHHYVRWVLELAREIALGICQPEDRSTW